MSADMAVKVRSLNQYVSGGSDTVYTVRHFCGSCSLDIDRAFGAPITPADLEAGHHYGHEVGAKYRHFEFCPWCGVAFIDEWWKRANTLIENERAIDHYRSPGHHKGDQHEFVGREGCYANHWLATTGDEVCWCQPVIEPGLLSCVIKHNDLNYDAVMAGRRDLANYDDGDDE